MNCFRCKRHLHPLEECFWGEAVSCPDCNLILLDEVYQEELKELEMNTNKFVHSLEKFLLELDAAGFPVPTVIVLPAGTLPKETSYTFKSHEVILRMET